MLLELSDVSKSYASPQGGSIEVLRGVSLGLEAGQCVAVVGPSGSGKSTLLNIMGALETPTQGSVRMDGKELGGLSEKELAAVRSRQIGFVFQMHHLLPQCSVLENVLVPTLAVADRDNAQARAGELLARVGLSDRLSHRPGQLSGGECQRVALARALINRPRLLLADEPTGSLDRQASENIVRLLVELNLQERTALVVVTHSLELAGRMNRVHKLVDGRLTDGANG